MVGPILGYLCWKKLCRPISCYSNILLSLLLLSSSLITRGQEVTLFIRGSQIYENEIIGSMGYEKRHPDVRSMLEELELFHQRLSRKGYLENRWDSLYLDQQNQYIAKLSLGQLTTSLRVYFDLHTIDVDRLHPFAIQLHRDHLICNTEAIEPLLSFLSNYLEEQGVVFNEVRLTNIRREEGELIADLGMTRSSRRTIDKIIVRGYEKFPRSYIKYSPLLRIGAPLSRSNIRKGSRALSNLPFIEQLKPPEILFTKDSSVVYLYMSKAKSNFFDGFVGFANDEQDGNIALNGYLNLRLRNNLNGGETLDILWKDDGNGQSRFNAGIDLPYVFDLPVGVDATLKIFRKDSIFLNTEQKLRLGYPIDHIHRLFLGVRGFESNDLLNETVETVGDLDGTFGNLGYEFLLPNETTAVFMRKAKVYSEFSLGSRTHQGKRTDQFVVSIFGDYLWPINDRNFIFLGGAGEFLQSEDYFDNEKFRFGGINSIRGFNENSLEATSYAYLNTEYRYLLSPTAYVHSILDFGYLQDDIRGTDNQLYGIGFGLGLRTAGGLLKLNYAVGATDESSIKLSESKVHISFSAVF